MASSSVLAKMAVIISANMAEFARQMAKGQASLSTFVNGLGKVAGAAGLAFGTQQIAAFAVETARLSGEAKAVRTAFERLPESSKLMNDLKRATGGTVSELELMKRAVQASNFDISLGALPRLLEFATLRAQQTGQSVDYLVDSIVTGIGRKSKLILDNLGISAVQLTEALGGASAASSSIGDVADAVGRIAEKNLKNMAGFSQNASTDMQKLAANWANLKVNIGNETSGVVGAFVNFGNVITESINASLADNVVLLQKEQAGLNNLVGAIQTTTQGQTARAALLKELNSRYPQFLKNLDIEKVTNEQLADRLKDVNAQFERKILLAAAEGRQKATADKILNTIDREVEMRKALVATQEALKTAQGTEYLVIAARVQALEAGIATAIQERVRLQIELQERTQEYSDALGIFSAASNSYFDNTKTKAEELNTTLEKLSQTAQRALGGTSVTGVTPLSGIATTIPIDTSAMFDKMREYQSVNEEVTESVGDNWIDLGGTVSGVLTEIATGLGRAGAGAENFGDVILQSLGGFMQSFGAGLIALGIGKVSLEKFSGPQMIAAGFALTAAGAALSASAKRDANDIGAGPAQSRGRGSSAFRAADSHIQNSTPELVTVIKGEDMWVMLQNYQNNNRYTHG